MFKALFLAVSAAVLPQALAVCSSGQLAIGFAPLEAPSSQQNATLWDSNCNILDIRSGSNDICGSYDKGSTVICSVGTEVPASAQLFNGLDYGQCERIFETLCGPNRSGNVEYCCTQATE